MSIKIPFAIAGGAYGHFFRNDELPKVSGNLLPKSASWPPRMGPTAAAMLKEMGNSTNALA